MKLSRETYNTLSNGLDALAEDVNNGNCDDPEMERLNIELAQEEIDGIGIY